MTMIGSVMKKYILLGALCFAMPFSAVASEAVVDVDIHASTLGFGAGFAFPVTENLAGRLSLNKFNYTYQTTSDNINYDSTLKLESIAALADWHLFSGITHLTAGLILNNNEFDMAATGTSFTINGTTYYSTDIQTLKANIAFNKIAPYLGFGWSGRASKTGFSFKTDIGVMFQGSPKSTLTVTGPLANDPTVAANVAAAQATLDNDMKAFNIYPVISLGMAYAF